MKTAGAIDPYRLLRRPQQLRRFVFDFAQQARHGQPVGGAQPVQQRRRRAGFGALYPRERRPAKAGALRQRLQRPPARRKSANRCANLWSAVSKPLSIAHTPPQNPI